MNQYPLIRGQTDLKARNPALAEEWDGIRNKGLTPEDVQLDGRRLQPDGRGWLPVLRWEPADPRSK